MSGLRKVNISLLYDPRLDRVYLSFPNEGKLGSLLVPTGHKGRIRRSDLTPFLRVAGHKIVQELSYMRHPEDIPKRVTAYNPNEEVESE